MPDFKVKMRTGRAACAAHFRNLLSTHHYLAHLHQALGGMSIAADKVIAVVNINHITILRMIIGIHYHPPRRRENGRSGRHYEVDTFMKMALSGKRIDTQAKT